MRPRIYIILSTFYPLVGGAERQALIQSQLLRQQGYEVTIMTFRYNKRWKTDEIFENVPVLRVAGRLLGAHERGPHLFQQGLYGLALLQMGWKLWRQRRNYDLIHLYQLTALVFPISLVCYLTSKPLLLGIRSAGTSAHSVSGKPLSLLAGNLNAHESWLHVHENTALTGDVKYIETTWKPLVRFSYRWLKHIGAVMVILSARMHAYLSEHDFILPHTYLIPNGVDTSRFSPMPLCDNQDTHTCTVVCVARFCYPKGIDVLLQAWHFVIQELPQAQLLLLGIGPLQPQLESMAQALDITHSIHFVGIQENVQSYLHRSSIAVLPSRHEGMSNALLEEMACGLACIATRVSGNEDLIEHEVNGLLVEPEDYQSLAEAIVRLLRDTTLRQHLAEKGRKTVEQRYELRNIVDRYASLYKEMLKQHLPRYP